MNLAEIDAAAWLALEAASEDAQSGFRFVNLCSVDPLGLPQARIVVLRRVEPKKRLLEIHTDTRSPKWIEMTSSPHVTVLGFCASTRVQLRLRGEATLHAPESDVADEAWQTLSKWSRSTYAGGPPGDEPRDDGSPVKDASEEAEGKAFFGVVTVRAASLDWFELRRGDNRRALFEYDPSGHLTDARVINP